MSTEKLSELSKPVATVDVQRGRPDGNMFCVAWSLAGHALPDGPHFIYSQEYVSAMQAERDAFEASALALRDKWRASKKNNAFLKEQLAKLANFNPDWDMLEACRESWREVAAALKEAEARLEAKDKRIAELEAIKAAAEKLVRCKGRYHSEQNYRTLAALFGVTIPDLPPVDGDGEAVIAELRAKLATPVRLPLLYSPDPWMSPDPDGTWLDKEDVKKSIRAAGFAVTVEGDEQ